MPKINRVRIANVPYGGKYIVDQLINCYNGENVLLNLANGGGKSVLTQMIMQPIVPNVKIHKRKVETYLTTKEPTFVMIEWLLDNTLQNTYFLTGIVMNKTATEENNYRVKYFTFVNEYKSSNPFDIKNIDFITKENGTTKYKSYDYCLKKLREQEGSSSKIETFTIDEQKRYAQILEQNGIFKDEWKILAKINEKEGGIDDLFEKCESSDDVINSWVLKTISERLENGDELREMFLNLMQDVMDHEEEIKQKEEIEKFKEEVNEYIEELTELIQNMDKEQQIEKELKNIFLKLRACIKELEEKHIQYENKIEEKRDELKTIDYEETSEKYYIIEERLNQKIEEEERASSIVKELENNLKIAEEKCKILQAAEIYKDYIDAKAEKESAFISKQKIENKLNNSEIQNIEYSLKVAYKKNIKEMEEQLKNIQYKIQELEKKENEIKEEKNKNYETILKLTKDKGVVETEINNFEQKENEIYKKLDIKLTRNILQELVEKDVKEVIDNFAKNEEEQRKIIEMCENEINSSIKRKANDEIQIKKIDTEIEKSLKEISKKEQEIKIYNEKTKELQDILDFFAIDRQKLFDIDTNLIEVERQREFVQKRNKDNEELLNRDKDLLFNLKNGSIHTDLKIAKILEKNKIDYETGEEYLKGQAQEYKERLLKINPLLPFCYIIMKENDYARIEELVVNEEINRLVPIILLSEIDRDYSPKNKIIEVLDNIKLGCLYNTKVLDDNFKEQLEKELEQEIEELNEKIKQDNQKMIKIENSIVFLKEYRYDAQSEMQFTNNLKDLNEKIDNIKEEKEKLKAEIEELQKTQDANKIRIQEAEKIITDNSNKKIEFEQFLKDDKSYMRFLTVKEELEKTIVDTNNKSDKFEKILDDIRNEFDELNKRYNSKIITFENLQSENEKIPNRQEGQLIRKSLEELKKIYEEMNSEFLRNGKDIEEKIEKANKIMTEKNKKLESSFSELKGKYENIKFTLEDEDIARKRLEDITEERKIENQKYNEISKQKVVEETNFKNVKSELEKLGKQEPIHNYLIKRNYESRRINLKEEIEKIAGEITKIDEETKELERKRMTISALLEEEPVNEEIDITEFDYKNIDIKELKTKLNQIKEQNNDKKRKVDDLYREIQNKNQTENRFIQNFLNNMNPYQKEFADYYYVYEKVTDCLSTLDKVLQLLKNSIDNIENDKNNIKHHAYIQGKNIYLEMKKISDSSDIKMPGKVRKTALLEIELPKELDQFAEERINEYIEECIKILREECKGQENTRQIIEKRIKEWLSDRQLLNKVINSETIGIKLYKIDISDKNSGLRRWEDVIVDNSGGEKLISCLIMVLALMQYTRRKVLEKFGEDEKTETSKFLVIDNPFVKMSSKHLLDGLMLILEKFNVQTICLSDISQSSITNQFKVIYQMSLKTGKYTDKTYLTTDNVIKNSELTENYLLENIFVKSDAQIKLW